MSVDVASTMPWYVIQTVTGQELSICQRLKAVLDPDSYVRCFVPMVEKVERRQGQSDVLRSPLYPGYLMVITDQVDRIRRTLWKVSSFKRLLRNGREIKALEADECQLLNHLLNEDAIIELSKGLIVGDRITVTDGPMLAQEGRIRKVNRHKRYALVDLPMMGQVIQVRLPLEIVSRTKTDPLTAGNLAI